MNEKRLLLINGSPRRKGTSFSFLRTVQSLAQAKGHTAQIIHIIDCFEGKADFAGLTPLIKQSDIICLSAPLYFDGLPYIDIWFLEKLRQEYGNELKGKSFFALSQGGFPDATLQQPPLEQCRIFAAQTGMNWCGGLGHGGGAIIDGTPLEELGRKGMKMTAALRMAVDAVIDGKMIPDEAQKLFAIRIPGFLYPVMVWYMNGLARKTARKLGVDFECRPYLEK